MAANEYGAGQYGTFLWGGLSVGPFPYSLELYLRTFLNDTSKVGDSYLQTTAIFNITGTQNLIVLTNVPTPYKPLVVLLNGAVLSPSTYSLSNNVLTFNFNLVNGNIVTISYSH